MLDRASTFADNEIVKLLKTRFIPVAVDQAYQRRQKDTEGEFFRKIAVQGPRKNFNSTTQGFYVATASGKLLLYNNNRDPEKLRRLLYEKLKDFQQGDFDKSSPAIHATSKDPRYNVQLPKGGLELRVQAKVLDGYEPTTDRWKQIFHSALSRDNLWVTAAEHRGLVRGEFPKSLATRIARFHLVDNTRGEPPMWKPDEVKLVDFKVQDRHITGTAQLKTANGNRGYDAVIKGVINIVDDKVVQLDMVARGEFWGEGAYVRGAPKGKFPLAISFTLADGKDIADGIPPQGSRGWLRGYLE